MTPNGVADLAGLRVGDVPVFDPRAEDDWILAGHRNTPEGFTARLPAQRADGTRTLLLLAAGQTGSDDLVFIDADKKNCLGYHGHAPVRRR